MPIPAFVHSPIHALRRLILPLLFVLPLLSSFAAVANMTPERMLQTIEQYADDVKQEGSLIAFSYKGIAVYCIFDANADRMRLVSPIIEVDKVPQEALIIALKANYHSVLDARYAIGDGVVHAVFIHPLSPLSVPELKSAIRQVSHAALTFGDEYSSGELFFPGEAQRQSTPQQSAPQQSAPSEHDQKG